MSIDLKDLLIAEVKGDPKSPFPSACESEVEKFETLVNAKLPPDYRQFLLTINGGTPDLEKMPDGLSYELKPFLEDSNDETTITNLDYLLSLNTSFFESIDQGRIVHSLVWQYEMFKESENECYEFVPPDCIPIAHGHATSVNLLLVLEGAHRNKVLWYNYDSEPTRLYKNVMLVANSFTEFVDGLGPGV